MLLDGCILNIQTPLSEHSIDVVVCSKLAQLVASNREKATAIKVARYQPLEGRDDKVYPRLAE